jgi:hypothetical protein
MSPNFSVAASLPADIRQKLAIEVWLIADFSKKTSVIPDLSNWGETLIFHWLKCRAFVAKSPFDR